MSGSRRRKLAMVATLAVAALLAVALAARPAPGVPGAVRGPWAVTREAFARLWNGALEAFGLRPEAAAAGAEPTADDPRGAEPAAGTPPAVPPRGGGTDPDG